MFYIDNKTLRPDGRFPNELRKINISCGIIDNIGFICLEQGNTQVSASLSQSKDKNPFNINLSFSQNARTDPINERKLYEMKYRLTNIFAPIISADYQVDIDLVVKQDDGSLFSVLVNSITLCLCYSGIPLIDMCISISLNESFDLSDLETKKRYQMTVVYLVKSQQLAFLEVNGRCQKNMFETALQNGIDCCKTINLQFTEFLESICPENIQ